MEYLFEPQAQASVPVIGDRRRFPVRRIFCVGRNYAAHAREMGHDLREPPFFFCKPADAVLPVGLGEHGQMPYPLATRDLHHEVELVLALGRGGRKLAPTEAADCIYGYAIGLDMTRRDLQAAAKAKGHPWDTGKAFDYAAPISAITPRGRSGDLTRGAITLAVNGEIRQKGDLADMIWTIPEIVAQLSTLFELKAGDLIFTGTPEGVAKVDIGDELVAEIEGLSALRLAIGSPA